MISVTHVAERHAGSKHWQADGAFPKEEGVQCPVNADGTQCPVNADGTHHGSVDDIHLASVGNAFELEAP